MRDESYRVNRGSCWFLVPQRARIAMRGNDDPGNSGYILGVRLVEETGLEEPEKEPASKSKRAYRGGSWHGDLLFAWVVYRFDVAPGYRDGRLGVRLVEEAEGPEPVPSASGSNRVNRGGSWYRVPQSARVAYRDYSTPGYRNYDLGVRLVEEVD